MAASHPLPTHSFQPSCFLTLPAEIRISIYQFIFFDSWIQIETLKRLGEHGWSWRDIRRVGNCKRHQILLSCRHFYREARAMWYASTIWDFNSLTVRPFLDASNIRPYLTCIKYVHLRDVHDLTQLWPGLLPSLRYVVAGKVNLIPWINGKSFEDMGVEETLRIVKSHLFGDKNVKTRIWNYLYHDGEGQKFLRKRSFCLHFRIDIDHFWPNGHNLDSQRSRTPTTWRFLVDLDSNTVEKHMVGPVHPRTSAD
jgi:hypothetical protein